MSKFTPGKWEVETHGISVFDERCEQTLFITDGVYSWANNDGEAEANARLIAAAPEMYRLLLNFAYPEEPYDTRKAELSNKVWELLRRIDGKEAKDDCN